MPPRIPLFALSQRMAKRIAQHKAKLESPSLLQGSEVSGWRTLQDAKNSADNSRLMLALYRSASADEVPRDRDVQ